MRARASRQPRPFGSPMRSHPLSLALLAALSVSAVPLHAQTRSGPAAASADADADVKVFDRVVVTATRTERALADVPNTVDEIDRKRMDELLVGDLKDL